MLIQVWWSHLNFCLEFSFHCMKFIPLSLWTQAQLPDIGCQSKNIQTVNRKLKTFSGIKRRSSLDDDYFLFDYTVARFYDLNQVDQPFVYWIVSLFRLGFLISPRLFLFACFCLKTNLISFQTRPTEAHLGLGLKASLKWHSDIHKEMLGKQSFGQANNWQFCADIVDRSKGTFIICIGWLGTFAHLSVPLRGCKDSVHPPWDPMGGGDSAVNIQNWLCEHVFVRRVQFGRRWNRLLF